MVHSASRRFNPALKTIGVRHLRISILARGPTGFPSFLSLYGDLEDLAAIRFLGFSKIYSVDTILPKYDDGVTVSCPNTVVVLIG